MYKRILVPLDGSAFAEHALPAAIAIARLTNAALHIVRVHEPVSATYASRGRSDEVERRHELEYLHAVAARAIAAGTSAVVTTLVEGWPSSAIEREIARTGVDLVHLPDGRALISFGQATTIPQLELVIADALEDPRLSGEDRVIFESIRDILRDARRSDRVALQSRSIIVIESRRASRLRSSRSRV